MAIKKGLEHYFCDNCGTHVALAGVGKVSKFCIACLGQPGGAHLNSDTLEFLREKIVGLAKHAKKGDEAYTTANELKLKLAVLFLEKITVFEANVHSLPDGPNKNASCKEILGELDELARKIYPILTHEKPEV